MSKHYFYTTDVAMASLKSVLQSYIFPSTSTMWWPDQFVEALNIIPAGQSFGKTDDFNNLVAGICLEVSDSYITGYGNSSQPMTFLLIENNADMEVCHLSKCSYIGYAGFATKSSLSIVDCPYVETIYSDAFLGCGSLSDSGINLPNLKVIKERAFEDCSNIKNVNFSQVTSVGEKAFAGCACENVILSQALYCDSMAFDGVSTISTMWLGTSSFHLAYLSSIPNVSKLAFTNISTIPNTACSNFSKLEFFGYGASLTTIGDSAFANCNVLKTFTNLLGGECNIASLGTEAFAHCNVLESFKVGSACSIIPQNCFLDCTNLVTVTGTSNVLTISDSAFQGCGVIDVSFPETTTMGTQVFQNCFNLYTAFLPKVSQIDYSAFSNASALRSVTLGITSVNASLFAGQSLLYYLSLSQAINLDEHAFANRQSLNEVYLPSVQKIASTCFYNCSSIETMLINNLIIEIGDGALYNVAAPLELSLPQLTTLGSGAFQSANIRTIELSFHFNNNYTNAIGSYTFEDASQLQSFTFPGGGGITSVKAWAFNRCTNLSILNNVGCINYIESGAFNYLAGYVAGGIGELNFSGLTGMGDSVFEGANVRTLRFPALGAMGSGNFVNCSRLQEVEFNNLMSIPESTFVNCYSLNMIRIGTTNCSLASNGIVNCPNIYQIMVPFGYGEIYKHMPNWSNFADKIYEG